MYVVIKYKYPINFKTIQNLTFTLCWWEGPLVVAAKRWVVFVIIDDKCIVTKWRWWFFFSFFFSRGVQFKLYVDANRFTSNCINFSSHHLKFDGLDVNVGTISNQICPKIEYLIHWCASQRVNGSKPLQSLLLLYK